MSGPGIGTEHLSLAQLDALPVGAVVRTAVHGKVRLVGKHGPSLWLSGRTAYGSVHVLTQPGRRVVWLPEATAA